jgi:hypothetical protein
MVRPVSCAPSASCSVTWSWIADPTASGAGTAISTVSTGVGGPDESVAQAASTAARTKVRRDDSANLTSKSQSVAQTLRKACLRSRGDRLCRKIHTPRQAFMKAGL